MTTFNEGREAEEFKRILDVIYMKFFVASKEEKEKRMQQGVLLSVSFMKSNYWNSICIR